ncbi:MAG: hypothetical protein QXY26_08530 [Ignisphaera sp.]
MVCYQSLWAVDEGSANHSSSMDLDYLAIPQSRKLREKEIDGANPYPHKPKFEVLG